jgi:hypothetical protein
MTKTYQEAMEELNVAAYAALRAAGNADGAPVERFAGDRGRDRQPDRSRRHAGRDARHAGAVRGRKTGGVGVMTRWSRPKSETPSARHTLARDAYAVHYGHIKDIAQALNNDQFDWLCASAARINCESIAEYLTEIVRDEYEKAKGQKK